MMSILYSSITQPTSNGLEWIVAAGDIGNQFATKEHQYTPSTLPPKVNSQCSQNPSGHSQKRLFTTKVQHTCMLLRYSIPKVIIKN